VYWFDSRGVRQGKYQECSDGNECTIDSCQGGSCVHELKCDGSTCAKDSEDYCQSCEHCGDGVCNCGEDISSCSEDCTTTCATVSILAKKEKEPIQWVKNLELSSGEKIDFLMVIANGSEQTLKDVVVKTEIPEGIVYKGELKIDGSSSKGDITSGIELGDLSPSAVKTIAFKGIIPSDYSEKGEKEIVGTIKTEKFSNSDSLRITLKGSKGFSGAGLAAIGFLVRQWYFWVLVIIALIFLFFFAFRRLFSVVPE